jgi:pectate lyase
MRKEDRSPESRGWRAMFPSKWSRRSLLVLGLAVATACGGAEPLADPRPEEPLPTGGAGGDTCRVNSLDEEGPGTLYDCITSQKGPRTIVFDVAGTLSLRRNTYLHSDTTIDGTTAGRWGITVNMTGDRRRALILEGPVANVVIRGLRFEGAYGDPDAVEYDHVGLDGTEGPISDVLIEHCTFIGATDGALDITGDVRDVIVRWNLFYGNPRTMLIKYGTRERLSLHRNVFAGNEERNPQIRGDARTIDFVNNVVYDWTWYGTDIRNDPGASVDGNFVGNAFLGDEGTQRPGFSVLNYDDASPGRLWVTDNLCSPPCSVISTVEEPLPVPQPVTPWPVADLAERLLPGVGAPARTERDSEVVERVMTALQTRR